jgi:hypothetical protein
MSSSSCGVRPPASSKVLVLLFIMTVGRLRAEFRLPDVAAHLRACGPCGEDFDGLLAAAAGAAS